jgi:C4-dicarboxylate transporter, DctM subunit
MERRRYDAKLSLGAIAVGGTLSVLVPPSLILIVYGSWENVSVARLFAAAMIPGVILMLLLLLTVVVMVKVKPELAPRSTPATWGERITAIKDMLPWLAVIVIVMGSIFGGLMTPTEASALGAVLSLGIAGYYGTLTYRMVRDSLLSAVKVTAMIAFIIFAARLLSFVFQDLGATAKISSVVLSLDLGTYGTMLCIVILYLILGMFFDSLAMMLLTLSFVMPIIIKLGYDPIWWGVTFVLLAEIGLVTPPFGLNLFTIHGVLPKFSVMYIARASLPFLAVMIARIWILIFFPQIALWLPRQLY